MKNSTKIIFIRGQKVAALFILTALMVFCQGMGSFRVPRIQPAGNGWEDYVEKITITKKTAAGLKPGQDSPEAAVVHFYASLIRKDKAYQDVLPPSLKPSDELYDRIQIMRQWTFKKVELRSRKEFARNRYWIMIFMQIEFQGDSKEGEDEIEVQLIAGKWCVIRPPL